MSTTTRSLQDAIAGIGANRSRAELPGEDDYDALIRSNGARESWAVCLRYVNDEPVARCARIDMSDVPAFRAWLATVLA